MTDEPGPQEVEERVRKKFRTDYSAPLRFNFENDQDRPDKTVDIGCNGTWLSADPLGRILQISGFHPKHGIVVAVPYEQFDGTRFRDPLYVRSYRTRMLEFVRKGTPGYGIVLGGAASPPREVSIITPKPNVANLQFRLEDSGVEVLTSLLVHEGEVIQTVTLMNPSSEPRTVEYELAITVSVNRASYGQLTEGGPIPIPRSENLLGVVQDATGGSYFSVTNSALDARLEGSLHVDDELQSLRGIERQQTTDKPVSASRPLKVEVPSMSSVDLTARFRLVPRSATVAPRRKISPSLKHVVSNAARLLSTAPEWKDPTSVETYIIRRTLDYIIGNCLMPVGDEYCAIVTDHVALPLGWNRDNYWQVRFLQAFERSIDSHLHPGPTSTFYSTTIRRTLKGHLHWVYRKAERPYGYWHRSYLVTGKVKDGKVFQLDQQLYPLVELCDFFSAYPQEADFVRGILREPALVDILKIFLRKADTMTGLVPTEESPGDDEIDHPFHFSTHVVLWYALFKLGKMLDALIGPEDRGHPGSNESAAPSATHHGGTTRAGVDDAAPVTPPSATIYSGGSSPLSSPDSIIDVHPQQPHVSTPIPISLNPNPNGNGTGNGVIISGAKLNPSPSPLQEAWTYVTLLLALTMQLQHFLVEDEEGRGSPLFVYVTNGRGKYTLYHDGNDIPTLFVSRRQLDLAGIFNQVNAQLGVPPPVDPDAIETAWQNTMKFAFSPRNATGFCGGPLPSPSSSPLSHSPSPASSTPPSSSPPSSSYPFGGLGSVHSHGAWTLGYFQEYMFGRICENPAVERSAWRRIVGAMQWDGSFAEAVDASTGRCTSKAWFSWPGAMIGAALVEEREEREAGGREEEGGRETGGVKGG